MKNTDIQLGRAHVSKVVVSFTRVHPCVLETEAGYHVSEGGGNVTTSSGPPYTGHTRVRVNLEYWVLSILCNE